MDRRTDIKSIIFICTANSGRSPVGEYYFRELCNNRNISINVDSAGTDYYNAGISKYILQLLKNDNIDASGHVPKIIDSEFLKAFDLILVMDHTHINKIITRFGEYKDKVYLLADYSAGIKKDIEDPVGMEFNDYIKIYNEIKEYLNKLIDKI